MIVEYKNLKYGYHQEGWERVYQQEYKDIQKLRLKLLIEDEAIGEVLREIYKIMLSLKLEGKPIELLDIGCGAGHQLCSIAHLCEYAAGFDISNEVIRQNKELKNTIMMNFLL